MAKAFTDGSVLSFKANADLDTKQYYLVEQVAGEKVDLPDNNADICIGVLLNKPKSGENASVRMLNSAGSCWMVASAAIAEGDLVVMADVTTAANKGKIRTLPTAVGTYYIVGKALEAATADGDIIEVMLLPAERRVV